MFDDLLLKDFVAELELVDAVDKVLLADEQTVSLRACTHDWSSSHLWVLDYFLKAKDLIHPQQIER